MAANLKPNRKVSKSFKAPLERLRSGLGWIVSYLPFDAANVWGGRGRLKVKGTINGFAFRTSLFPTRDGRHFLLINKRMQKGAHAFTGTAAQFRLEQDFEERTVSMPDELKRVLSQERTLLRWFDKLNYSTQKWIADWVTGVKSADARVRRSEQVAEQLLSTMEAERELPPMIQLAFARNPRAREGWEQMSAIQRRGNLLAVFYYRTTEGRARRLAVALVRGRRPALCKLTDLADEAVTRSHQKCVVPPTPDLR